MRCDFCNSKRIVLIKIYYNNASQYKCYFCLETFKKNAENQTTTTFLQE
jgi:hypothetical protein